MVKILILGAGGQIGLELTEALNKKYSTEQIILSDIKEPTAFKNFTNTYLNIDVTDKQAILAAITEHKITQVYHLAAMLSATAEKNPQLAWEVNIGSLLSLLEIARKHQGLRIYWPSSIAVFGNTTPPEQTPQHTITEPSTVYGIAKYAGELWCQYYRNTYGVDVRSLRYPGIISWKTQPGGGTTDYAVDIYHAALRQGKYTCYLSPDRALPMMYMEDAIRATLEIMDASLDSLSIAMAYNISALSFTPEELAASIREQIPAFEIKYAPDYRDAIAASWPHTIDDSLAQKDWQWSAKYDLAQMTSIMLQSLQTTTA